VSPTLFQLSITRLVAVGFEEGLFFSPVGADFDEEFEEDGASEELFYFLTGALAEFFEGLAFVANDDLFLCVALNNDGAADEVFAFGVVFVLFAEFVYNDFGGVGYFAAVEEEYFFADDFAGEKPFRCRAECVFGVEGVVHRQVGAEGVDKLLQSLPFECRDGEDCGGVPFPSDEGFGFLLLFGVDKVAFVEDGNEGLAAVLEPVAVEFFGEGAVKGSIFFGERDEGYDGIGVFKGVACDLEHCFMEFLLWLHDAGCVEKDDLRAVVAVYAGYFFSGGLRLVRNN